MQPIILNGACIKLYINNKLYKEVQSVSYELDHGEYPIHGIDTSHPQEIAVGKVNISGSVSGLRIRNSGGLQAYNARPALKDILASPYISLRIQDRDSKEDILFVPNIKITKESAQTRAKGGFQLSFSWHGLAAFNPLDRA